MATAEATERYRDIYTVSRLTLEVRDLLELTFPLLWIEGEISNLARPPSGHLYFSLKDAASQVRCVMFRSAQRQSRGGPRDGQKVLVRGRVSLYTPRGDFQVAVDYLEDAGSGDLRRAFDALKEKLLAEGLFDPERKRPLPAVPRRIGLVTSSSGAAVHDLLQVLGRRFPAIPVLLYPVPVQGPEAAPAIVQALALAGSRAECDVLILARGGGSLEDLQPFNEESVARAIAASPIPVVTGVGHEVDFTIADFVADHRAPTPSAAAEAVTPDRVEWQQRLGGQLGRLVRAAQGRLVREHERLGWLARRLRHPSRHLLDLAQRLDGLTVRLLAAQTAQLTRRRGQLASVAGRLERWSPRGWLAALRAREQQLASRVGQACLAGLTRRLERLEGLRRALEAVSPLATLRRGYAVVTRTPGDTLVGSVARAAPGEVVVARLVDGRLHCRVEARETGEPWGPVGEETR
jgi:exodeoxyribonuclease VII large subunit